MLKPLALAVATIAALGTAQAGAADLGSQGHAMKAPGALQLAQGGGADIRESLMELQKERQRQRAERERQKRLEAERQGQDAAQDAARQQGQPDKQ